MQGARRVTNFVTNLVEPSAYHVPYTYLLTLPPPSAQDGWKKWDANGNPTGNCVSGHLDFDVYPKNHDVSFLGAYIPLHIVTHRYTSKNQGVSFLGA